MATSNITLDTGSTLKTGTYTISEDAVTKHIPRSVLNNSSGAEVGINGAPLIASLSGGTLTSLGSIAGTVTITGTTNVVGTVTITGSTTVVNTVTITGSTTIVGTVPVSGTVTVTGSTAVVGTVTVTGSTAIVGTVTVTGSTTIVGTVTVTGSTTLAAASKTQIVDGSGNVIGATANALDVNIKSGAGSGGTALTDGTTFNVFTTSTTPIAGVYLTTRSTLTTQSAGTLAITAKRALLNSPETPNGDSVCDDTLDTIKVSNATAANFNATITGSTTVVGTVTITGSTTLAGSLPAGTNNIGDVDIITMPTVTITGSTTIVGTVTITGSTTLVGTSTITGSTSVVNTVTITGSTTLVNIQFPSSSSLTISATTAGTTILIPSTATGSIYVTDFIVSNGASAGNVLAGEAVGVTAPTTTAIKIQPLYFAANGGMCWPIRNPIKLTASRNFVITAVSSTTLTATATYYVAP